MIEDALRLSVYFGERSTVGSRLASDVLLERLHDHGMATAALLRGLEGFGVNRRVRAERFPDASTDPPLVVEAVGGHDHMRVSLEAIAQTVPRGLVTLEPVVLATGDDVERARLPDGPGAAAELRIYCGACERAGRLATFRAVVALLRRHGAAGAIVLAGVDGLLAATRARGGLWTARANVPMLIIAVGPPEPLARSLPHLAAVLRDPVVTLERTAQLKHDGDLLEPLPECPKRDAGTATSVFVPAYVERGEGGAHGSLEVAEHRIRRLAEAGGAPSAPAEGSPAAVAGDPPLLAELRTRVGDLASRRGGVRQWCEWSSSRASSCSWRVSIPDRAGAS